MLEWLSSRRAQADTDIIWGWAAGDPWGMKPGSSALLLVNNNSHTSVAHAWCPGACVLVMVHCQEGAYTGSYTWVCGCIGCTVPLHPPLHWEHAGLLLWWLCRAAFCVWASPPVVAGMMWLCGSSAAGVAAVVCPGELLLKRRGAGSSCCCICFGLEQGYVQAVSVSLAMSMSPSMRMLMVNQIVVVRVVSSGDVCSLPPCTIVPRVGRHGHWGAPCGPSIGCVVMLDSLSPRASTGSQVLWGCCFSLPLWTCEPCWSVSASFMRWLCCTCTMNAMQ
jgi:hypothetical protein